MTLEATPPEQEPIRMMPAATSGSKPNARPTNQPSVGMIENCKTMPISTALGILSASVKSRMLKLAPMPNMMICVSGRFSRFKRKPFHSVNKLGQNMAAAVPVRMKKVNVKTCSVACLRKYNAVSAIAPTRPGPIPACTPPAQDPAKTTAATAAATSKSLLGWAEESVMGSSWTRE